MGHIFLFMSFLLHSAYFRYTSGNCAVFANYGGWWHNSCSYAKPNAIYGRTTNSWSGIVWHSWKGRNSLKTTMLKVRCDWLQTMSDLF